MVMPKHKARDVALEVRFRPWAQPVNSQFLAVTGHGPAKKTRQMLVRNLAASTEFCATWNPFAHGGSSFTKRPSASE